MHPRSCHPTVCDQEIPQILSNHVVLFQLLAPPEPPQTRQQKRRSVIKTVLGIIRNQQHCVRFDRNSE